VRAFPAGVELVGRQFRHQFVTGYLCLCRFLRCMNQLGVHGLAIKINFVRTYDQLSCVGLDASVEHGVDKLLLGFQQLLFFFSLGSVACVKDIIDVVSTTLGDDRAVSVVEMLVAVQDWIGIGIATNALFEIRDTVGSSDTGTSPQR